MQRKDYDTLERTTRIVAYGSSWLERQDNVKTVHGEVGRAQLAREVGKSWYVRLPDAECEPARAFALPRQAFWDILRETWDAVLDGTAPFVERVPAGAPPRFARMLAIEQDYIGRDLSKPALKAPARSRIIEVIEAYRARDPQ